MNAQQILESHQHAVSAHTAFQARRQAAEAQFRAEQEGVTAAHAEAEALIASIVPTGMPGTNPDKYRAHIFRTEITERLKAFGFDPRFWQDGLFANARKGTREAKQSWVSGQVVSKLENKGAIVAMVGDRGTGKTSICAQIAIRRLWEDWEAASEVQDYTSSQDRKPVPRRSTLYRKLAAIVSRLKALYADYGAINIERLESERDHLAGVALLVIDELHECADDSKHKDRILADILDRRYAAKRDTILITNQPAQEFRETINPSVLSRLNEHGAIIPCEWQSFRDRPAD